MCAEKAILTDVKCIIRDFGVGTVGDLIDYVIATNSEMASRIRDTFVHLEYELGLTERSTTAYLMGYLRSPESLQDALSEVPDSSRPPDEVYWSTLDTLRNSIKLAEASGSYMNQIHQDFAIAATDWIRRGFKCVVYSHHYARERILEVLECTGFTGDVIAVKVPSDDNADWLGQLSRDLTLDLPASFFITSSIFGAQDIRRRFQLKTAVLESSISERPYRHTMSYDQRGYYLVIYSFLDIDPAPKGIDLYAPITDDTSLAPFLKAKIK